MREGVVNLDEDDDDAVPRYWVYWYWKRTRTDNNTTPGKVLAVGRESADDVEVDALVGNI
jgi:hypothetical protein